jgi:hypothetical protein
MFPLRFVINNHYHLESEGCHAGQACSTYEAHAHARPAAVVREYVLAVLPAERERALFIGTQFSILYTSMYSPAEAVVRECAITGLTAAGAACAAACSRSHTRP